MITGLTYIDNYFTKKEEFAIIQVIDSNLWDNDLKRRTQQYGYKYDYTIRNLNKNASVAQIPKYLSTLISDPEYYPPAPHQVIINEYLPGQGIGKHKDAACFGDKILSISLLSFCTMVFNNIKNGDKKELILAPGSLLILEGPARHEYTHEIPTRTYDMIEGEKVDRQRRVSITFRTII